MNLRILSLLSRGGRPSLLRLGGVGVILVVVLLGARTYGRYQRLVDMERKENTRAKTLPQDKDYDQDGRMDIRMEKRKWFIRVDNSWVQIGMMQSDPRAGCRTTRREGKVKHYWFVDGEWVEKPKVENGV